MQKLTFERGLLEKIIQKGQTTWDNNGLCYGHRQAQPGQIFLFVNRMIKLGIYRQSLNLSCIENHETSPQKPHFKAIFVKPPMPYCTLLSLMSKCHNCNVNFQTSWWSVYRSLRSIRPCWFSSGSHRPADLQLLPIVSSFITSHLFKIATKWLLGNQLANTIYQRAKNYRVSQKNVWSLF